MEQYDLHRLQLTCQNATSIKLFLDNVFLKSSISKIWLYFNQLGYIADVYKKYKYYFIIGIFLFISLMSIYIYPIKFWMALCLICTTIVGYLIRRWETFPVLYGFFLTDLFYNNLIRVIAIYT